MPSRSQTLGEWNQVWITNGTQRPPTSHLNTHTHVYIGILYNTSIMYTHIVTSPLSGQWILSVAYSKIAVSLSIKQIVLHMHLTENRRIFRTAVGAPKSRNSKWCFSVKKYLRNTLRNTSLTEPQWFRENILIAFFKKKNQIALTRGT